MTLRLALHHLRTHAAFVFGPLFGLTSILAFRSTEDLFFDLDEEHLAFVQFGWFAMGLILGFVMLLQEQVPQHREIALQRGTSVSGLYWGSVLAGGALALVIAGGALVLGTGVHLVGPDAGLVTSGGVVRLAALGTSVVAGFGLGAFLTTLRGAPWLVSILGLLALGAVLLGEFLLVLPSFEDPAPSIARYFGAQCAFGALTLAFGSRGYLLAHDPSRPVPLAAQVGRGVLVASSIALAAVATLPELQRTIARALFVPIAIGRTSDGRVVVGESTSSNAILSFEGEARGAPIEVESSTRWGGHAKEWSAWHSVASVLDGTPIAWAKHDFRFGATTHRLLFHPTERLILDSASGELEFARRAPPWDENADGARPPAVRMRLARPDGRRFGSRPTVVGGSRVLGWMDYDGKRAALLLGDLDDGTLWRVHLRDGAPRVEAVAFPGGDRLVGWGWSADIVSERGEAVLHELPGTLDAVVLRGERGRYAIDPAGTLVATQVEIHPWRSLGSVEPTIALTAEDPFRATIEFPPARGAGAATYEYTPRTAREKLPSYLCAALSLLRPPIALDHTFESLGHGPATRAVCRPLAALGLAFLVACVVATTLARRGADRARIASWGALVLSLGVPAAIAFLLLERRAAFAPMPAPSGSTTPRLTLFGRVAPGA